MRAKVRERDEREASEKSAAVIMAMMQQLLSQGLVQGQAGTAGESPYIAQRAYVECAEAQADLEESDLAEQEETSEISQGVTAPAHTVGGPSSAPAPSTTPTAAAASQTSVGALDSVRSLTRVFESP